MQKIKILSHVRGKCEDDHKLIRSLTIICIMYVNEIASNVKQEKMEIISLCERRQKMSCTNLDFSLTRAVLTVFVYV